MIGVLEPGRDRHNGATRGSAYRSQLSRRMGISNWRRRRIPCGFCPWGKPVSRRRF